MIQSTLRRHLRQAAQSRDGGTANTRSSPQTVPFGRKRDLFHRRSGAPTPNQATGRQRPANVNDTLRWPLPGESGADFPPRYAPGKPVRTLPCQLGKTRRRCRQHPAGTRRITGRCFFASVGEKHPVVTPRCRLYRPQTCPCGGPPLRGSSAFGGILWHGTDAVRAVERAPQTPARPMAISTPRSTAGSTATAEEGTETVMHSISPDRRRSQKSYDVKFFP